VEVDLLFLCCFTFSSLLIYKDKDKDKDEDKDKDKDKDQPTTIVIITPSKGWRFAQTSTRQRGNKKQLQSWVDQLSSLKEAFILVKENTTIS